MRWFLIAIFLTFAAAQEKCGQTVTTASGSYVSKPACSGELIFQEEFDDLDFRKWQHENTLSGGGSWEFQWYTNNRSNSFVKDGVLHIKPTLTADHLGENALYSATLDLNGGAPADYCTNAAFYGCTRTGSPENILNPIKSARIRTVESFSFKYGRIQVRAKMPAGDWIWPAIWMMPRYNAYGGWPTSGEIDIAECRGNRGLELNGKNIGTHLVASTLHWGPDYRNDVYPKTHWEKENSAGYDGSFHVFEVIWTPDDISVFVDGERTGGVTAPSGGFWELGGFANTGMSNPWHSKMAPFDQEFYIIANVAVGGVAYFPDEATNPTGKPWKNNSPTAAKDFWEGRESWLKTWNQGTEDSALQIDYIRVYAL